MNTIRPAEPTLHDLLADLYRWSKHKEFRINAQLSIANSYYWRRRPQRRNHPTINFIPPPQRLHTWRSWFTTHKPLPTPTNYRIHTPPPV